MRCIDDFSRSSVNASVQTCESPKPHTIDVFAAMCVHLMEQFSGNDKWVGRTFDLIGAYRQCAVKPSSAKYSFFFGPAVCSCLDSGCVPYLLGQSDLYTPF
jgi:hypothetical protein